MKTLPTSETPQLLVLCSDDMKGVAFQVKHEGFQTTQEVLKESDFNGGLLLPSASLIKNRTDQADWYKVVVFASSFQIFSTELLDQLGALTRPLLIVVPVFTHRAEDQGADKTSSIEDVNQVLATQPILLNQLVSSLSSACLLLVDGLVGKQSLISSNITLFQSDIALNSTKLELPAKISVISQNQLLYQVLNRLTSPQLGSSSLLVSEAADGQQLYQKISKHLEQCYQFKTAPADFSQANLIHTPPIKTLVLPADDNVVSELLGINQPPKQYRDNLNQMTALVTNRLKAWNNLQEPPPLINTELKGADPFPEPTPPESTQNHPLPPNPPTSVSPPPPPPAIINPELTQEPIDKPVEIEAEQAVPAITPIAIKTEPAAPKTELTTPKTELTIPSQLDHQLASIFAKKRVVEKKDHQSNTQHIKSRIRAKSKRRSGLFVGGAVLSGVSLAILFFVGSYSLVSGSLSTQVELLVEDLKTDQVPTPPTNLSLLTDLLDWQNRFYDHLFDDSITQLPTSSVRLAKLFARLSLVDTNYQEATQQALSNLFVSDQTDLLKIEQAVALQNARLDVWQELLPALLESHQEEVLPSLEKDVNAMKSDQAILSNLFPHLSQLLGFDSPKIYAVIFQNTQELRSTGGFVQSLGTVTVDKGQITSTQTYSSYEIDKMLGGVVEPPADLVQQLGEKQLYFRDSNWDPNFPSSAETMTWFLGKSLNTNLEGVLALTTAGLQDVLSVTGPLVLPESGQTISAQNLLERLESNSSVQGLTPNEPREYSAQVMSAVLDQLTKLSPEQNKQLFVALNRGFKEANILAFHKDSAIQQVMVDLGWSGAVLSPPCPSPFGQKDCRIDPFYLNENNIAINKANSYLQRKNQASIRIDESSIKYRFLLSYENKADVSSWPKGSYLAYARAFLPPNANGLKISVDGVEIPEKQLTMSNWEDRLVAGFNFEVPIKSSKQVVIEFDTPPLSGQESYVFFMQKQPGVSLQQSQVAVDLPNGKSPQQVSPGAVVEENRVVFSPTPNPHLLVGLSF